MPKNPLTEEFNRMKQRLTERQFLLFTFKELEDTFSAYCYALYLKYNKSLYTYNNTIYRKKIINFLIDIEHEISKSSERNAFDDR